MRKRYLIPGLLICCLAVIVGTACYVWLGKPTVRQTPPLKNVSIVVVSNGVVVPATPASDGHEEPQPAFIKRTSEEIVGIGAILRKDQGTGALMIAGVVPNSPAAAAGLAGNFVIRKIDDAVIEGMGVQECVNLLRGVSGSTVRLELFDGGANETRTVELIRRKVPL